MKVTGLETILVDNIPPYRGGRQWLFIKLMTDAGLVGLGERVTGHARSLASQIALLTELCEEFVVGEDPFQIERIWGRMYGARHDYRHPGMDSTMPHCLRFRRHAAAQVSFRAKRGISGFNRTSSRSAEILPSSERHPCSGGVPD